MQRFVDVLQGKHGKVRFREYRTATYSQGGRYNLRVGNPVPARVSSDASIPMPTLVTANDISTNGFKLIIDGYGPLYEISIDGVIVAITAGNEFVVTDRQPNSNTTVSVVAVRANGQYSQVFFLTVTTRAVPSLYPFIVGDVEPTRNELARPPKLIAPDQVTLNFVDATIARVSWTPAIEDLYEVSMGGFIVAIASAGYVDVPVLPSTIYTARVRAIDHQNQYSSATQETAESPAAVATTLPSGTIDNLEGDYSPA